MTFLANNYNRKKISFKKGLGSYLVATNGKKYLDFCSGIVKAFETCQTFLACLYNALTNLGFACPKLLTAIPEQKSKYLLPFVAIK